MKKYCLTDCFKEKLSAGKKTMIEIISVATVVIIVLIGGTIVFGLLGFTIQGIYYLVNGNLIGYIFTGFIEAGFVSSVGTGLVGVFLHLIIIGIKNFVYKPIKALVTNTIETDSWSGKECSIFEECKEGESK